MRIVAMQEHHQEFLEGYYFTPSELEKAGPGWLIRAGVSQAKPNYHMGPKMSPYHYLIFVLEGAGRLVSNRTVYELRPNDAFGLFPNTPHEYYTLKDAPMLSVWMAFDGRHLSPLLARIGLRPQTPYLPGAVSHPLTEWLDRFFEWHRSSGVRDSDLFRLSMFYRLFDILSRQREQSDSRATPVESWLQRAAEYMRIHYAEGITAQQVAQFVGIDRTHFSKKFTNRYGLSPGKYIQRLKMDEARRLLTETDYKLSEIAQLVGYPDLFSFSKGFKKTYGLPPSRHRPRAGSGVTLPEAFIRRISALHGKPGEQWLRNFPRIITYCENKWRMRVLNPYPSSVHFTAPVVLEDGTEAVLKLGVPCLEIRAEIEALSAFGGSGTVRLLDAEADRGIMLLEKAVPGQSLASAADDEAAARAAAAVMRALGEAAALRPSAETFQFESLSRWGKELEELWARGAGIAAGAAATAEDVPAAAAGSLPVPEPLLRRAQAFLAELNAAPQRRLLLHGNLSCRHLLSVSGNSWAAIHPKGIIGPPEYEAVPFLLSSLPAVRPGEAIKRRAAVLAEELGLDVRRTLMWGLCHCVLSACRSMEESPGGEGAGRAVSLAGLFAELLEEGRTNTITGKEVESA